MVENELLCVHCNRLLAEVDLFSCCNSCAAKGCCKQTRSRAEYVSFRTEYRARKASAVQNEADLYPSTQGSRNFDSICPQAAYATALVELITRIHDDRELEVERKKVWELTRQREASLAKLKDPNFKIE
jgi:hypothetical protein